MCMVHASREGGREGDGHGRAEGMVCRLFEVWAGAVSTAGTSKGPLPKLCALPRLPCTKLTDQCLQGWAGNPAFLTGWLLIPLCACLPSLAGPLLLPLLQLPSVSTTPTMMALCPVPTCCASWQPPTGVG